MRILLFFLTLNLIFFYSCCKKTECSFLEVKKFRLYDKIDSTSYFFCTNKKADFSKSVFYSINNNNIDTFNFLKTSDDYTLATCDSMFYFDFTNKISNKIYMKTLNTPLDSFEIFFRSSNSNCCEHYFAIDSIKFNTKLINYNLQTDSYIIVK
jgi:hypothetical protein